MSNQPFIAAAACVALFGAAAPSQATQFGINGPRALAMAGVGVSAADGLGAMSLNPALLSTGAEEKGFQLGLPIYSVRSVDRDELGDDLDRLELPGQTLRLDIGDLNISLAAADIPQSQLDAGDVARRLAEFNGELQRTGDKSLDSEEFIGAAMAIPDRRLGMGIQVAKRTEYGADYVLAAADSALLANLSTLAAAYAASGDPGDLAALRAAMDLDSDGVLDDPTLGSRLRVRGLILDELAMSFARRVDWLGGIDAGVTPKFVRATTIDYAVTAQDVRGEIDLDRGRQQTEGVNLDIGLAKAYDTGYRAGIVIKNALSKSYATASGNRVELRPQLRAGVSYHDERTVLALDLDLGENDHSSLGTATQFAALGAEYQLGMLWVRAGYRHDLADRYRDTISAGFGLDVAGLKFELGVAGNQEEIAGSLSIGIAL